MVHKVLNIVFSFAFGFLSMSALLSIIHFHRVTENAGILLVVAMWALCCDILTLLDMAASRHR